MGADIAEQTFTVGGATVTLVDKNNELTISSDEQNAANKIAVLQLIKETLDAKILERFTQHGPGAQLQAATVYGHHFKHKKNLVPATFETVSALLESLGQDYPTRESIPATAAAVTER